MRQDRVIESKQQLQGKRFILGVDPSGARMDCVVLDREGLPRGRPFSFQATAAGFTRQFPDKLQHALGQDTRPPEVLVAVECSMNLWRTFAAHCEKEGYTVVLVSPLSTYHSRPLRDGDFTKTDAKDAFLVAENALNGRFMPWRRRTGLYAQLQGLGLYYWKRNKDLIQNWLRLHSKLEVIFPELRTCCDLKSRTAQYLLSQYLFPAEFAAIDVAKEGEAVFQVSRGNLGASFLEGLRAAARGSVGVDLRGTEAVERMIVSQLLRSIELIQADLEAIQQGMTDLARQTPWFRILTSIPGVGAPTALLFLAEVGDLRWYRSSKQIEKLAGLNLRLCDSGKMRGSRQISGIGNKRLRCVIYTICYQMGQHEPLAKRKLTRRRLKGGNLTRDVLSLSSLCLRLIMSLAKRNTEYRTIPDLSPEHPEQEDREVRMKQA